ncbi:DUF726 domain-containing protein [Planctomycetota bacterium]|nr:DUF726 domain-containing protein [Planctomycetota bacterium]
MMRSRAQLTKLSESGDGADDINVFIHGYKAVDSKEHFEVIKDCILDAMPGETNYLYYWKSGTWTPTRAVLFYRLTRKMTKLRRLNPVAVAAELAAIAAFEVAQFKYKEYKTKRQGRKFIDHISRVPGARARRINLIGHSLGARVIYHALTQREWVDYRINDCVFLGGAADVEGEWDACVENMEGNIYNGYSKSDWVLPLTPDLRDRVGRKQMEVIKRSGKTRVFNKRLHGVGHTDYWPCLMDILPRVWKNEKK